MNLEIRHGDWYAIRTDCGPVVVPSDDPYLELDHRSVVLYELVTGRGARFLSYHFDGSTDWFPLTQFKEEP